MKSKKKQRIYLTSETVAATLFALGSIFAINYVEFRTMSWILLFLFGVLTVIRLIGALLIPGKRIVRFLIPLGIALLLVALLLICRKNDAVAFYIGWISFFFLILHDIELILEIFFLRKKEANEAHAGQSSMRKEKTLWEGNYSKRQQDSFVFLTGGMTVSAILFSILLAKYIHPGLSIFICLIFFAGVWLFSFFRIVRKETAFIADFIRSADFPAFKRKTEEILSRNLHPETENYIRMIRHIYESSYRENDNEFETFFVPKNIAYRLTYESMRLDKLWEDERWYTEYRLLKADAAFAKKYKKFFDDLYLRHEAMCRGILEKPIDQVFPLNPKMRYLYASNLYMRACYFHASKDMQKRDETIGIFQKEFPEMIQLRDRLIKMIQKNDSAD